MDNTSVDKQKYLRLLKQIVNVPSITGNKKPINQVNDIFMSFLRELGFKIERFVHPMHGDFMIAKRWNANGTPRVLFSGHTDIVPLKQFNPFRMVNGQCFGNGIGDMKAGLVVMAGAAEYIVKNNLPVNLTLSFSPDEEHASAGYRAEADHEYTQHDYALVFETGKELACGSWKKELAVVTSRKGVAWVNITTHGTGGHAGNKMHNRDNAIEAMAYKIVQIKELMNIEKGITLNIGTISGGEAANVIARECEAIVDIRTKTRADQKTMIDNICALVSQKHLNTMSDCNVLFIMPPLEYTEESKKLLNIVKRACSTMQLSCIPHERGGGSDANYISGCGVAVLDGFGAVASDYDKIHTPEESIYTESLFQNMVVVKNIIKELTKNK